ncbi:MAG: acyl carrier protein [Acidobacteria bacterium]|nr:acyl carrier protein [Acidobacteriota bacterium]
MSEFRQRLAKAIGRSEEIERKRPIDELGVDSFALVDIIVRLQEELGVRIFQEDLAEVKTVGDLEDVFESRAKESG